MEKIANGIWKVRLGTPERLTPVKMRDSVIAREGLARLPKIGASPYKETSFKFRHTARGFLVEFPLDPNEQLYGFGLQTTSHNQRGLFKVIRMNCDPMADPGNSRAPVPFFVSTRGYGVLVDTNRHASFWCGAQRKVRPAADNKRETGMAFEVQAAKGVDLFLFAGPTVRHAVQRYNLFSGGGVLPPL